MNKSEDRRSAIVDQLADYVLAEGLSASSLRPLAQAANMSDRMLLYYFKDKADILTATLERIAERMTVVLTEKSAKKPLPLEKLRQHFQRIVLADDLWPFMSLWLEIASFASRNDPFYRAIGEQIGRGFLEWGASQLKSASPKQRETEAAELLVMIEGMVLLKSLGLEDVCRKIK